MIKAITFDLDNTLIDFMRMKKAVTHASARAMVEAGLDMRLKDVKNELFREYIKDIEGNHVFQDFFKKHNISNDRILAAALNAHMRTKFHYLRPYTGVRETLLKLKKKGLKLAIVTDAPRIKAYQRLDAIGLADFFDFVVAKEDTGKLKPSTIPFKAALDGFNLSPSEVMHVGDWPDKDILGAKSIGMKTCFARYGYLHRGKPVMADYKIEKFEDILNIV